MERRRCLAHLRCDGFVLRVEARAERFVREGRVTLEKIVILKEIYAHPECMRPGDDWLKEAQNTRARALRRRNSQADRRGEAAEEGRAPSESSAPAEARGVSSRRGLLRVPRVSMSHGPAARARAPARGRRPLAHSERRAAVPRTPHDVSHQAMFDAGRLVFLGYGPDDGRPRFQKRDLRPQKGARGPP